MVDAITSKFSTGAVVLIVIFSIAAAFFLTMGIYNYNNRLGSEIQSIGIILVGLALLAIALIPLYYKAPPVPIISRVGNTIQVTNYASLGPTPKLEFWQINIDGFNLKIHDMNTRYNSTTQAWTLDMSMSGRRDYVVRNYVAGLVFSQSASITVG